MSLRVRIFNEAANEVMEMKDVLTPSGARPSFPLNAKFDYTITVANNALVVTAKYNGVTYSAADPISAFWPGKALYFKAGVYVQVGKPGSGAGTTGSGKGQVSFYRLDKPTHP